MALANVCWGLFVLPESLPAEKRVPFSWRNANPLGALKLLRSHPTLAGLAASFFLMNLAHVVLPSTTVLYLHYRYGWDTRAVGVFLAGVGISSLLVQGFLVKPAVRWLKERRALAVGLSFGAAGFAIYGLAPTGAILWTRCTGDGALGYRHALDANADDAAGGRHRAGAAARRAREPHRFGEPHRSDGLYPDFRRRPSTRARDGNCRARHFSWPPRCDRRHAAGVAHDAAAQDARRGRGRPEPGRFDFG